MIDYNYFNRAFLFHLLTLLKIVSNATYRMNLSIYLYCLFNFLPDIEQLIIDCYKINQVICIKIAINNIKIVQFNV